MFSQISLTYLPLFECIPMNYLNLDYYHMNFDGNEIQNMTFSGLKIELNEEQEKLTTKNSRVKIILKVHFNFF